MNAFITTLLVIGGFILYLLPFIIASNRRSTKTTAVGWLNLLFGWSGIVWVVLLFVAFLSKTEKQEVESHEETDDEITARVKVQIREEKIRAKLLAENN